jgi:hypothetical protein
MREEKRMKRQIVAVWIFLMAAVFFLGACGGGSGGGTSSSDDGTGTLRLSLVDAPGGSYQAVYVTIKEVQVCAAAQTEGDGDDECEWQTVGTPNETYNLLELVNGVMATLGQEDLPAGTYNQMRLLLSCTDDLSKSPVYPNYLIDMDDVIHELKVPSGCQSGIKLVHPFDIAENMFTELILDFDVARSVVKAGNSGNYLLKPTIKVIGTHDYVIVSGTVTADEGAPIEGASVTVWPSGTAASSPVKSTVTDEIGGYTLYLEPRAYTLVTAGVGYTPDCQILPTLETNQDYQDINFRLTSTGTVTVGISISGIEDGTEVNVSFRQALECFSQGERVETAFFTVTAGVETNVELSAGYYTVIASTGELSWVAEDVDFTSNSQLAITFE